MNISTPYPWLDLDVVEANILKMTKELSHNGIHHRPHIKTHKSIELARLQLSAGARGITCSKLSEAMVMARAGIKDILVAYSLVGADKMERLAKLMEISNVIVTVDNQVSIDQLSKLGESMGKTIPVLIEIGSQNQRGGIYSDEKLLELAKSIEGATGLELQGIFTYVGLRSNLKEDGMLEAFVKEEANTLLRNKEQLEKHGYKVNEVSAGSTATSTMPHLHGGITESRAGNYIFNDMNAVYLNVATLDECALKIRATVISTPKDGLATIDAGSKTLSSDTKEGQGYGYVVGHPDIEIYRLNEEHGYLNFDSKKENLTIGQQLDIIPNHSCVVTNLHDCYFAFRNNQFDREISIDARGKNY